MTWLAELKPNTALNHRGVVDGSRERKGARRQRFLIQINTEPPLSSKALLSNIDCSNSQWLFQHSLGNRLLQIHVLFFYSPQTFSLFCTSIWFSRHSSIPLTSRLSRAIFSRPLHWQSPTPPPPQSPGSSFLVAQKTSVTDCLPTVRLRISCVITLSWWGKARAWIRGLHGLRRSPAEYRRSDRQPPESTDGLTSHRGEGRHDLHAVVALAHRADTGWRERPAR